MERLWRVHMALLMAQLLSVAGDDFVAHGTTTTHDPLVLRFFHNILAVFVLFPAAFLFERHNPFRLLPQSVCAKLFLLGFFGIFGSQMLLLLGNKRTTPQSSLAMQQPAIPVFTAIVAILFRVEKLNLRRRDSRAKLAGTTLCCAGATLMAFYRGPYILGEESEFSHFNLGALCLLASSLCVAFFVNLQATLLKQYPAPITVVAYCYLFGAIFMGASSYFLVHDSSAWNVSWNADLIAILYKGIISSALCFGLTSWALPKVGPLFVASYIPVQPVAATTLAAIFFKGSVYLGSVLGTVMIALGLLLVSWALEEAMRLAALSRIVEQSTRLPAAKKPEAAQEPELTTPLLQV